LPKPLARVRVEAAKAVVMLDLAILNAEAAAGMFTNSIEVLAKEVHHEPLPGEVRAVVIAAWRRGGLLPKEVIDQLVPQTTAGENFCEKWTKHPKRARACQRRINSPQLWRLKIPQFS
jgi:hypothetical protein